MNETKKNESKFLQINLDCSEKQNSSSPSSFRICFDSMNLSIRIIYKFLNFIYFFKKRTIFIYCVTLFILLFIFKKNKLITNLKKNDEIDSDIQIEMNFLKFLKC